jgi:hypothetical protein
MIPQIASLLAPLASEAGKQTIKWGGIVVAVLVVIGICGFGIYQKKRGDKLEVIAENAIADKVRLQNEIIVVNDHYKTEIQKMNQRNKDKQKADKKVRHYTQAINPTIAKDSALTTNYLNCMADHFGDTNGECSVETGEFIKLVK